MFLDSMELRKLGFAGVLLDPKPGWFWILDLCVMGLWGCHIGVFSIVTTI